MSTEQILQEFISGIKQTGWVEYIAVFAGAQRSDHGLADVIIYLSGNTR